MLGIWLVLRLFAGGLDPSDTIVIPAVSHQSAWHLGGQVEKGGTGGKASERGGRGESKGAGRERSSGGGPGSHFACDSMSVKFLRINLLVWVPGD